MDDPAPEDLYIRNTNARISELEWEVLDLRTRNRKLVAISLVLCATNILTALF